MHTGRLVAPLLFVAVGLGLIALGYYRFTPPVREFLMQARPAQGVIVSDTLAPGSLIREYPQAQYEDETDSRPYRFLVEENGRLFRYRVGDIIRVFYIPGSQGYAKNASFFSLWYEALMVIVFGAPFALAGLLALILTLLQRPSLFRLGTGVEKGSPSFQRVQVAAQAGAVLWALVFILKSIFDIPAVFYPLPYLVLSFAAVFMLIVGIMIVCFGSSRSTRRQNILRGESGERQS